MNAAIQYDPYRFPAGILALVVHSVFFALLFFGFSWNRQLYTPPTMSVELWRELPQESAAPPEKPKVEEVVATPQETKVAPDIAIPDSKKPVEKPAEVPLEKKVPVKKSKPDIEQQKLAKEKERLARKQKARELAERLRKEDQLAREQAEKLKREEEASREQEAKAKQNELAAAQGKVVDEYRTKIQAKIRKNIVEPPDVSPDARAEFSVTVLPGGVVLPPKLIRSSGNAAYDDAVERAILKSDPLPMPADVQLFNRFRNLNLVFKPEK